MTQHPLSDLSPPELRGYARGLRETAALLHAAWSLVADSVEQEANVLVDATIAGWKREAELVEGFAARLERGQDHPQPVTLERVEKWVAGFEPPIQGFAKPARDTFPLDTKTAAELETLIPPGTPETGAPDPAREAQPSRGEGTDAGATAPLAAAPTPDEAANTGLADAVAEDLAEQPPAKPAEAAPATGPIWSPERLALLRRLYPTIMHLDGIHAALNALPGTPIATPASMKVKASNLGLHRRGEPIPEQYAGARETGRIGRKPAIEAAPKPEPIRTAPPALLPEEVAEARERLRTGESKGAKDLAEWFGCSLETVQPIVDAHRAQQEARKA